MTENPFSPPMYAAASSPGGVSGFNKGWIITDLVFCVLRVPLVLLGIVGMISLGAGSPLIPAVVAEVLSGLGICLFGIVGNTLLLMRKPAGVPLAWLALLSVLLSVLVGIWQLSIQMAPVTDNAHRLGMMIGAAFVFVLRVGLNVVYAAVVVRVKNNLATQQPWPANWA